MSTSIPSVNTNNPVINAEFVKLTLTRSDPDLPPEIYTFSNSYKNETFGGVEYLALSSYLNVATQQRDLQVTNYDTAITITGFPKDNIYLVLGSDYLIKGSAVEIWRGFYNSSTYILESSTPVRRYSGLITGYTITEERNDSDHSVLYTVTITCANYQTILENRYGGRYTEDTSWKTLGSPGDTSMKNVPSLINAYFDFGRPVSAGSSTTSSPQFNANTGGD